MAPEDVTYQGLLLDSAGDPVAGPVEIEIGVWSLPTGGFRLYWETHLDVALEDGVFNLLLGTGSVLAGTFDANLFAVQNRYLEVTVDKEVLEPRQPFSSVAYALQSEESEAAVYAETAGDADTVDGSHAASLDQSGHVSDTGNPHGVTAAQTGAATTAEITAAVSSHAGEAAAHHSKTTTFSELTDQAADAQIPDDITVNQAANSDTVDGLHASAFASASHTHDASYYTQAQVDAIVAGLQAQIDALTDLTQHLSRSGDDLYLTGANLHIVDGSDDTGGTVNGLGNLIVGYNELRGDPTDDRTGSHNLIVGSQQSYSSYGGLVAGSYNSVLAPLASITGGYLNIANAGSSSVSGGRENIASAMYASVSGGRDNTAGGTYSSVSGGAENQATGERSSVSGGENNTANQYASSVSGGADNTASGDRSSVSGGFNNTASGDRSSVNGGTVNAASDQFASVNGGAYNEATGERSSVSGGENNTASQYASSVTGGSNNTASGFWASVAGGGGVDVSDGNEAFANYAAILGGERNLAGDPDKLDHAIGEASSVSGGADNTASGDKSSVSGGGHSNAEDQYSSVSGGLHNTASGYGSSVSGGRDNTASEYYASVSGGENNTASGYHSSVTGGKFNTASGNHTSVTGGEFNTADIYNASVSGGHNNTASGSSSTVSGGADRTASGTNDWVAGSLFENN